MVQVGVPDVQSDCVVATQGSDTVQVAGHAVHTGGLVLLQYSVPVPQLAPGCL